MNERAINLNTTVRVRLTKEGRGVLSAYYSAMIKDLHERRVGASVLHHLRDEWNNKLNAPAAGFLLWDLIHIFGPSCIVGSELFVGSVIMMDVDGHRTVEEYEHDSVIMALRKEADAFSP